LLGQFVDIVDRIDEPFSHHLRHQGREISAPRSQIEGPGLSDEIILQDFLLIR
jgi:hypothetical protein